MNAAPTMNPRARTASGVDTGTVFGGDVGVRDDRVRIRRARRRRFERGNDHDQDADVDESEDRHQDLHRSTHERIPTAHGDWGRSSGPGYKGGALPRPVANPLGLTTSATSLRERDSMCKPGEGSPS